MSLEKINPAELAAPIGFSHAVKASGSTTIYLAGQTALNKDNMIEGKGIVEQFEKVMTNLLKALSEAGGSPENLVKLKWLACFDNKLTSLEEIEKLTNLRFLYCHRNKFSNEYKNYLRDYCNKKNIRLSAY